MPKWEILSNDNIFFILRLSWKIDSIETPPPQKIAFLYKSFKFSKCSFLITSQIPNLTFCLIRDTAGYSTYFLAPRNLLLIIDTPFLVVPNSLQTLGFQIWWSKFHLKMGYIGPSSIFTQIVKFKKLEIAKIGLTISFSIILLFYYLILYIIHENVEFLI